MEMEMLRPTWAEVYLDNIVHNIREIRRITDKKAEVMAVVKADGYGHGAVEVARKALDNGADRLAVAILDEGLQLRRAGITAPILILGYTPEGQVETAVEQDMALTVYTLEGAEAVSRIAGNKGTKAKIHIKLDTGMGRLGFLPEEKSISDIVKIFHLPDIIIEGIFTHFATADEKDKTYTRKQFERYMWVCSRLEEEGITLPIRHVANSAAIIDFPEMHLDMVRAGLILYGMYPSEDVNRARLSLKPAMALKTRIAHVKKLPPGCSISYGATFTTTRDSIIATLPLGYADGYTRLLSNKGEVLVKGRKAPVVGRVCMDQCMIDVTHIEGVGVGDEVVLFGRQQGSVISAEDVAGQIGTINYEVVCMVGKRVPRLYFEGGKPVSVRMDGFYRANLE
ncbi:Alanine racemase 1 [Koleobacter methoxysyntrophicus]|jgi:alanine racemase|uniref:Alanine racemase n=1 Tax=Koleobacter methoxysyntrophicus TaxID=2751313 RepID=A0A8A0RHY3_9FIRM|nr:alanine racemase [Koleobacter methoxysyntrophicus]QSQ07865.1 Alanine racemase 1 [Koleobacter methoxysyntrophicus]